MRRLLRAPILALLLATTSCGTTSNGGVDAPGTGGAGSDAAPATGSGGRDGAAPADAATSACASLGSCACMAAPGCTPKTEACYCPTECDPSIRCICGGGRFLSCEPKP